ncbi:MAG: uroporphyrinogen-III C-methyltransferase [Acidimicrobiales bacterium]
MTVYLVGAGPGDAGLLTLRGAELLRRADAVVYDRLVHPSLLHLVPPGAELHDAGKRPGGRVSQDAINDLLVDLGRRCSVVVRLKGGDPLIFGRGGEETLALQAANLPFEIVPGVSAMNGVLAYAGIPLTHRGLSTGFTVVTGHGADGTASGGPVPVDWDALARVGGTIVILMGVEHRAEISRRLIAGGKPSSMPVAVIEHGTLPNQRTLRTTLGALGATDAQAPATVVVGEVAALDLAWFTSRPLFGWTVAITRTRDQASQLAVALAERGAVPVEVPTIAVVDPADGGVALRSAAGRLGSYSWVVFTSINAVGRLLAEVHDARAFGDAKVAAIGDGTARALAERGIVADLVPGQFVAEALADAFPAPVPVSPGGQRERVLLPRAAVARDVLPRALAAKGYEIDIVEAYRTVRPTATPAMIESVSSADAVMFSSSSTVTGWIELLGTERLPPVVACIGPITAATAREAGIEVTVEASEHSIGGLVDALVTYAATVGRPSEATPTDRSH